MKAPLLGLALALSLTGCQAVPLLTPPGGTGSTGTSLTALRLGSLQFKPASADTVARLSQQASGTAAAAAPMAAEGSTKADAAKSPIAPQVPPSPYAYNSYFGGPFGQMKLESVTEANAAGASAGFLDLQAHVIGPALADWAPDARLLNTNGTLDAQGNPMSGTENYPGELAWHASYASISRNEVLDFTVSANQTHVVRMHWVPVAMDVASIKVDAKAAVDTLTKAIGSQTARSKEDELGHDYFFDGNTSTGNVGVGIAVPAIAVGEPAPMPMPGTVAQGPSTETLYRLAPGGRWSVNLQAIGDKLVWELNYNIAGPNVAVSAPAVTAMPASAPRAVLQVATTTSAPAMAPVVAMPPDYKPQPWTDESAYGMVDARTGALIRLRRPTRYTYADAPTVQPQTGTAVRGATGGGTTTSPTGKE